MKMLRKMACIVALLALTVVGSVVLSYGADGQSLTGKVVGSMDAGGYTYIQIDNNGEKTWVAVPKTQVVAGQELTFGPGMEMIDFESKTLKRKFDRIYFSDGIIGRAK